jgi:hypothetical protein
VMGLDLRIDKKKVAGLRQLFLEAISCYRFSQVEFSAPPQLQPIRLPVFGSTLLHDLRNSAPLMKNIFIAIPANARPSRREVTTISFSISDFNNSGLIACTQLDFASLGICLQQIKLIVINLVFRPASPGFFVALNLNILVLFVFKPDITQFKEHIGIGLIQFQV